MIQSMKAVSGLLLLAAAALMGGSLVGCVGDDPANDPSADGTDAATQQLQDSQLQAAKLDAPSIAPVEKARALSVPNNANGHPIVPSLEAPAADDAPATPPGDPGADPGAADGKTNPSTRGANQMDPEPCPWSQKNGTNT